MDLNATNATLKTESVSPVSYAAVMAAWIVPGLGHLLLRRWQRAAIIFFCVGALAVSGYAMRGQVYSLRGSNMLAVLGHLAEIGTGAFYFLARVFEPRGADTARVTGDFGTRFLVIAGLLNFLCILDAWEIARERKN